MSWRVIALSEQGMSSRAISARLGIPKSTVCNIVNRHAVRPGDVFDRPRSGRPRKTTPREDRRLARIAMRNRFSTTMELRRRWNLGIPISRGLVLLRLRQLNIRNRRPVRKPELTQRHRQVSQKRRYFISTWQSNYLNDLCYWNICQWMLILMACFLHLYFRSDWNGVAVKWGTDFRCGNVSTGATSVCSIWTRETAINVCGDVTANDTMGTT